jgi:hypothetical protein
MTGTVTAYNFGAKKSFQYRIMKKLYVFIEFPLWRNQMWPITANGVLSRIGGD